MVKVQRPIYTSAGSFAQGKGPWLIYDKFRARECTFDYIPTPMLKVFDSAPRNSTPFYKQYFDNATWLEDKGRWDLRNCTPITRRLIW